MPRVLRRKLPHLGTDGGAVELDGGVAAGAVLLGAELAEDCGAALLVPIDQQDILTGRRPEDREIDGDRGFADPAFGVPHCDDHDITPLRLGSKALYNSIRSMSLSSCPAPPCPPAVGIPFRIAEAHAVHWWGGYPYPIPKPPTRRDTSRPTPTCRDRSRQGPTTSFRSKRRSRFSSRAAAPSPSGRSSAHA